MKFSSLLSSPEVLEALGYMGFEDSTPIQQQAIPLILENKDLIACAQTGTGKTAAFILPILEKLFTNKNRKGTNTLVICPTRELAIQIEQQIQGFAYFLNITSLAIYGGGDGKEWEMERTALKDGTDIVVATPGKLLAHIKMGYVDFSKVEHLILDEADRMLDMGFVDDILKVIKLLPKTRQSLFFSATMPSKIKDFAEKILTDPQIISLALAKPAEGVLQCVYLVHDHQKVKLVRSLLDGKEQYESIIIFSSTKKGVSAIVKEITGRGYNVGAISSDYEQKEREAVLLRFKSRETRVLVATDVISRGIDIKDINLVINFDVPGDAQDYVHRVGRTARANTTGVAITFVNEKDMSRFNDIEELIETKVYKSPLPADFEAGPEWNPKAKRGGFKKPFKKRKK